MDVTPQTLREVEFREKMRGYHPEDVDAFLERVADGLEVVQERLRQALERAAKAEQQAAEAGGTDETLRKTLLLAQRTADLAVQEAREQASRILAGAEQQAQGILGEAEERARQAQEEAQVALRADVARLEAARTQLQEDVSALSRWLEDQKEQLGATLNDALGRIKQLGVVRAPPPVKDVDIPDAPGGGSRAQPTTSRAPDQDSTSPSARSARPAAPKPDSEGPAMAAPRPEQELAGAPGGGSGGGSANELSAVGARFGAAAVAAAASPVAPPQMAAMAPGAAAGPPTQPVRVPPDEASDQEEGTGHRGDPFLAELRRAVNDRGPLGPREVLAEPPAPAEHGTPISGLYDQSEEDDRTGSGRLWRRR
jgi:cell division initiation protein